MVFIGYTIILVIDKVVFAHNHGGEGAAEEPKCSGKKIQPFVSLLAIGIHALFEGMACGLGPDLGETIKIVAAITLHKWAAAMYLGIQFQKTYENNMKLIYALIVTFALMTPIGLGIGLAINSVASELVGIVFFSLACGTFVYIACTEVLSEEFGVPGNKWLKFLAFFIGAAMITALWWLEQ